MSDPRIEELFATALELPAQARPAFLAERCAGDPALEAAVHRLLTAADGAASGFLARPAVAALGVDPAAPPDPPRAARIGRYAVLDALGAGAMGRVYAAYDERLDRRVALKLLRTGNATPGARERLRREAQAMARLGHPNVVVVYDAGEVNEDVFIAMELVAGQTLASYVAGRTWREILNVYLQAARGLEHAHRSDILHRDFKPENVLVDGAGRAKVADFGLAARAAETALPRRPGDPDGTGAIPADAPPSLLDVTLTQHGAVVGTPAFMAPEVRAGRAAEPASDQYSFCVALERALFGGGASAVPGVPPWLAPILRRGMAQEAAARWPSMQALIEAIEIELRHGPAHDARFGARERRAFGAVALATALAVPVFLLVRGTGRTLATPGQALRLSFVPLITTVAALVVWRRSWVENRFNRQGALLMLAGSLALVAHRTLGYAQDAPVHAVLAGDLLVIASVIVGAAVMGNGWLAASAVLLAAGAAVAAFVPPHATTTFGVTSVAALLAAARSWVRAGGKLRAESPDEGPHR